MVFVVPDEHGDLPCAIGGAVEYVLHMSLRPGVDDRVAAVVAVVAQGRRDERERREAIRVEVAKRPNLVGAMSAVVGTPEIERGNVFCGVAARAARTRSALDIVHCG
jgi:hypothetical protein